MRLENELVVWAPADQVWEVMLDLGRITACVPGLRVEEVSESGKDCRGGVSGDVGPFAVDFRGGVRISSVDEDARRVVYRATGEDANSFGVVTATAECTLTEEDGQSRVTVTSDLGLPSVAEQFGGSIVREMMDRAFEEVAGCVEREAGVSPETDDATAEIPRTAVSGNGSPDEPSSEPSDGTVNGAADDTRSGATVEGAVVVGRSPSEAAASARTTDKVQPQLYAISTNETSDGKPSGGAGECATESSGGKDQATTLRSAGVALAGLGIALIFYRLLRRSVRR